MEFEDFRSDLQSFLNYLDDPDYQPGDIAYLGAGCDPYEGVSALQVIVLEAIASLGPEAELPPDSGPRRDYDVLHHRYVLRLSQEETALRLGLSLRSLQRAQRQAIHVLARQLWDRARAPHIQAEADVSQNKAEWHSQVRQELVSLEKSASGWGAPLADTLAGVLRIARLSLKDRGIRLQVRDTIPDVKVRVHPTVLRQILLDEIHNLAQSAPSGAVTVGAHEHGGRVRITISCSGQAAIQTVEASLARELLAAQGGRAELSYTDQTTALTIELPTLQPPPATTTVLVVDDNPDMATVFEAYCIGTRYRIVSLQDGQHITEAVRAHAPGVILLDVMLPGVDGWDLLLELTRDPATRQVPVIVCSVVTDERLALRLGAAQYLRKPVSRQQLISALDQLLSQAAADA